MFQYCLDDFHRSLVFRKYALLAFRTQAIQIRGRMRFVQRLVTTGASIAELAAEGIVMLDDAVDSVADRQNGQSKHHTKDGISVTVKNRRSNPNRSDRQ